MLNVVVWGNTIDWERDEVVQRIWLRSVCSIQGLSEFRIKHTGKYASLSSKKSVRKSRGNLEDAMSCVVK